MRPRVGVVGLAVALGVTGLVARGTTPGELRPPDVRPSSGTVPLLGVDRRHPDEPVSVLFFGTRPATPIPGGGAAVIAPDGGVVRTNDRLQAQYLPLAAGDTRGVAVGVASDADGWWLATTGGELLRLDATLRVVTRTPTPFPAASLWPLAEGGVILARSPDHFSFLPEAGDAPLLVRLGGQAAPHARGRISMPEHALLASVANAGSAVRHGDLWIFAPVGAHQVVAFTPDGDTAWKQAGPRDAIATPEPRFVVGPDGPRIAYQPWNFGLTMGPDGLLYRLRAADTSLRHTALDVLDPSDGTLLRSAALDTADVVLAVNARGRLHGLPAASLLGAVPPERRTSFPSFGFPDTSGRLVTNRDLAGRIGLVNFWASWCLPCREEMPALDSLRHALAGETRFTMLGINVDARRDEALAFLHEVPVAFPTIYGGSDLGARFGYPGLPYTALVDPDGRIIRRYLGALSASDLAGIAALVRDEIARFPRPSPSHAHAHSP